MGPGRTRSARSGGYEMAGTRSALIVATSAYDDARLAALRSPHVDAEALAGVLADPEIGDFEVTTVLNRPWHEVSRAVAQFFRDRRPDDLVLLHFSCHGLKDDSGELYFAATDTSLDLLEATAVASSAVNRAVDRSRAGRVLMFLDCCYAGAFARGMVARAGGDVDVNERLGGRGRAVITAASAMQYAFEDSAVVDEVSTIRPSLFTNALVEGLRTGDADLDLDGWVGLDELYAYVHDAVTAANPDQTPRKWTFDIEGDLRVARRGTPVATPAELPAELHRALGSVLTWERIAVVEPLGDLARAGHPGRALAAKQILEDLAAHDDSERVRAAARTALGLTEAPPPAPPAVPAPTPVPAPAAAAPAAETPAREPTPGRRPGRGVLLAAVAVLVALAAGIGYVAWPDADTPDGGDGDGITAGAGLPVSDLVATQVNDGPQQLVAIHSSGNTTPLVDSPDASGPSLNKQRTRLVVLESGDSGGHQPWLVDDLTSDTPTREKLFTPAAEDTCPDASSPTWDSSGGYLALVCHDLDGASLGLWVLNMNDEGNLPEEALVNWASITGAPSWGGDGRIYFVSRGKNQTSGIYWVDPGEPSAVQQVGTAVEDEWLSHPDWCEQGLLFQRSPDSSSPGSLELFQDGKVVSLATPDTVEAPTWAPDCAAVAWLGPSGSGDVVFTAPFVSAEDGGPELGTASELEVSGEIGPPAWGDR